MPAASRAVFRQAAAGLLWGKQFYHFNVHQWQEGDPGQPPPPPGHTAQRNSGWQHMHCLCAHGLLFARWW
jgi:hypothetical protein